MKPQKTKTIGEKYEEQVKVVQDCFEKVSGGMFLLGMSMGQHCHEKDDRERIKWFRRNFDGEPLATMMDKSAEDRAKEDLVKCSKCNKEINSDVKFCSNCGEACK